MELFLTSSPGGNYKKDGQRFPCPLDNRNHFAEKLQEALPKEFSCLFISAGPEEVERNDSIMTIMREAFTMSGMPMKKTVMCDARNAKDCAKLVTEADFIILCGGHVPTQNAFFQKINLKMLLTGFDGVVMGISAGTMNCAGLVYAQPELEGEAVDPDYRRYIDGLGLTDIKILPHFQDISGLTLDGLRVLEDISMPDSKVHPFYALPDGSYVHVKDGRSVLHGEAYYIADGKIQQICKEEEMVEI